MHKVSSSCANLPNTDSISSLPVIELRRLPVLSSGKRFDEHLIGAIARIRCSGLTGMHRVRSSSHSRLCNPHSPWISLPSERSWFRNPLRIALQSWKGYMAAALARPPEANRWRPPIEHTPPRPAQRCSKALRTSAELLIHFVGFFTGSFPPPC